MNTKPNWLKNDKRIIEWEREADGICVVTNYGFAFDPSEDSDSANHISIFENSKEARAALKYIRPCPCLRCTSKGKLA